MRRKARVEIVRNELAPQDGDALAGHLQMRVDGVAHLVVRPGLGEVDMRHLAGGMDAGIGAAGAAQRHCLAAESLDRLLDRLLHRRLVRPAAASRHRALPSYSMSRRKRGISCGSSALQAASASKAEA